MKILFLLFNALPTRKAATNKKIGGLNTIVFYLSHSLAARREDQVSVACCNPEAIQADYSADQKIEMRIIVPDGLQKISGNLEETLKESSKELQRHLILAEPDIVHTSGSEAGMIMALAKKSGVKLPWIHTNYATLAVRRVMVEGMTISSALSDETAQREHIVQREADHVIALSETDKKEICFTFGLNQNKVTVVQPGIDRSIFLPGQTQRDSIVASAGRMSKIKDFPFLLRAFRMTIDRLSSKVPAPSLVIIGGNQKEREVLGLPRLAENFGIKANTIFLDGLDQADLAIHLQKAKVFVGCSKHETFGLLPIEAAACGTPVIVRANSSYLTAINNDKGKYFVDNNDEKDMAEKIAAVLSLSDDEWKYQSKAALDSINGYTWAKMAQGCLNVYHKVRRNYKP